MTHLWIDIGQILVKGAGYFHSASQRNFVLNNPTSNLQWDFYQIIFFIFGYFRGTAKIGRDAFLIFLFPILTNIKLTWLYLLSMECHYNTITTLSWIYQIFIAVGCKACDAKKDEQLHPVKPFVASFYLETQLYKLHIIKTNQSKGNKKVLQND